MQSFSCTDCGTDSVLRTMVTPLASGAGLHRIFECPSCGHIDWDPPALSPAKRQPPSGDENPN